MADNVTLDAMSGGDVVGADEIASVKYQRVKIIEGADGVNDGDISSANGLPVELLASTAAIGKLAANSGVDIGDVDVLTLPADPLGANADAATTAGSTGSISAKLRLATSQLDSIKTAVETIDNVVAGSEAQVDIVGSLPAGTNAIGKLSANSGVDIGDVDVVTLPADPLGANADAAATAGSTGSLSAKMRLMTSQLDSVKTAVEIIDNMISGSEAQVDVLTLPALVAGTAAIGKLAANSGVDIGDVDVITMPALAAGTNAIGKLLPPDIDVTTHTNYAKKYYTNAGAVTDGIVWSPAAGKRWHVTALYINVSAAATITLEDDKAAGDEAVWKGELAANSGVIIPFGEKYPLASGEDAADLIITTTAGNVYVLAVGYEI